jgi:signal peptidase I
MFKNIQVWYNESAKSTSGYYLRSALELFFIIIMAFAIRTFGFGLYQVPSGSMETTFLVGERFLADKFTYWLKAPQKGEIIAFNAPDIRVSKQGYAYSTNPVKNLFERYVYGPSNWTKRIIGVPGDHVQGKIENSRPVVYVNGKKLDEPYLNKYPLVYKQIEDGVVPVSYDPAYAFDKQPFYHIDPIVLLKDQLSKPGMIHPGTPVGDKDIFDVHLKDNQYWVMGDNRCGSEDSRFWGLLDGSQIHARIIFRIWSIDSNSSWWILDLVRRPIDFFKKVRWSRCLQSVA